MPTRYPADIHLYRDDGDDDNVDNSNFEIDVNVTADRIQAVTTRERDGDESNGADDDEVRLAPTQKLAFGRL